MLFKMLKNKKNVVPFLFLIIISLFYTPYFNVISWGGDYGTYLDQSKAMFSNEFNEFIDNQNELLQYQNNRYPLYTPFGFPLLIKFFSYFHNYDLINVKLLIPIFFFACIYVIYNNLKSRYSIFLIICLIVSPNIQDQFREIQTEIPTTALLIFGFFSKNKYLKILFFIIAVISRPSFLVFVIVYLFYDIADTKTIKIPAIFISILLILHLVLFMFFDLKFYGFYESQYNSSGIFDILSNNLGLISVNNVLFIIYELGRLITGFSTNLNYLLGALCIIYLLISKNKYSVMCLLFIIFHNFWIAGYYVRYFLPILFLLVLSFDTFINENFYIKEKYLYLTLSVFISVSAFLSIYQIQNLDAQRGPLENNSKEMLTFIKKNYDNTTTLFTFHSPRVFNLITEKKSYVYDKELVKGTIIICEYNIEKCVKPSDYNEKFTNAKYVIFGP